MEAGGKVSVFAYQSGKIQRILIRMLGMNPVHSFSLFSIVEQFALPQPFFKIARFDMIIDGNFVLKVKCRVSIQIILAEYFFIVEMEILSVKRSNVVMNVFF